MMAKNVQNVLQMKRDTYVTIVSATSKYSLCDK